MPQIKVRLRLLQNEFDEQKEKGKENYTGCDDFLASD
jgi:hypothetical protein